MATRAVRNNNPGNLRPGVNRILWDGQIGTDKDGFAIFNSWSAGVRAAGLNLLSYFKRGWDTPKEIAYNWSTTDQAAYSAHIARSLGVSENTVLDMNNETVRNAVAEAIFKMEDSNYKGGSPAQDIWSKIMDAAKSGNPIDVMLAIPGAVLAGPAGVVNAAGDAVTGAATAVGSAFNFNLGDWISEQLASGVKEYIIPIVVGVGAIILIMVSGWGLVKDTGAGKVVTVVSPFGKVKAARKAFV